MRRSARGGRALALGLRQGLLFLAGFSAVAAAVRTLVPWPEEYGLRAKFEFFAEHRDEFDALYIGSSRVFRAFDPTVFDAELAANGVALRSFNFGVGGMRGFEQDYLLRRVLELDPARLEWVFLEGGEWDPEFDYSFNAFSWRSVFWHSPRETLGVLATLWRGSGPVRHRLELAHQHLLLALHRFSSYGQGREVLKNLLGESAADRRGRSLSHEALASGRGFESAEELAAESGLTRDEIWTDPDNYRRRIEVLAGRSGERAPLDELPLFVQRRQLRLAREHGIELIYVLPPGLEPSPVRRSLHDAGEIPTLFDFNLADSLPQLFDMDHRFDPRHLNRRGAQEFSRAMAREFVRHLRGRDNAGGGG